jgi:UDP-N-acetylglucosamine:LPS N-acetylglucosamine transferase
MGRGQLWRRHICEQEQPVRTILLISASFGGGHDAVARRMADHLGGLGYDTRMVDLVDLLPLRIGRALRGAYRLQLGAVPNTWTWTSDWLERSGGIRVASRVARLAATRIASTVTPETVAVMSTYPLASQLLGQLREDGLLQLPVITALTDLSVHRLWIAEGVDAHIAQHEVAAEAASRLGARNVTVCSPTLPEFFRPAEPGEQAIARRRFGLPESVPLALIVTGSWGVGEFAQTAKDIAATGLATPVIACGRNESGRARLAARGIGVPLGWVDDMPALFHASDVVIQSGGGCSVHEALACGRPVLTYRCLPGHGRMNAAALHDAGWAPWIRTREDLPDAIASALRSPVFVPEAAGRLARVIADVTGVTPVPAPLSVPSPLACESPIEVEPVMAMQPAMAAQPLVAT